VTARVFLSKSKELERDVDSTRTHRVLDSNQSDPPDFPHLQLVVDPPHHLVTPPRVAVARDRKQIVGGRRQGGMCARRRRGHADDRDFAIRSVDPDCRMDVIVPVQDEIDAMAFQDLVQCGCIGQPLDPRPRVQRMMNQKDTKRVIAGEPREHAFERLDLRLPERARRHEERRRKRGRQPDQRERPAPPQEGERHLRGFVASEVGVPALLEPISGGLHIGIVIAGNGRDPIRRSDAPQPCQRWRKLGLECEVDEIAGERDVIGDLRLHVRHQRVEHVAAMIFVPVARPVQIAERALSGELGKPGSRQGCQMRIGQMRQRIGCHHTEPTGLSARCRQSAIMS
jgi:hypothetical protein